MCCWYSKNANKKECKDRIYNICWRKRNHFICISILAANACCLKIFAIINKLKKFYCRSSLKRLWNNHTMCASMRYTIGNIRSPLRNLVHHQTTDLSLLEFLSKNQIDGSVDEKNKYQRTFCIMFSIRGTLE